MTTQRSRTYLRWVSSLRLAAFFALAILFGCGPKPGQRNDLTTMQTAQITVKDTPFNVWLALTNDQRSAGLMQVTQDEMAPVNGVRRGMLFVFPDEEYLSFWMANTITALDIAFIDADGQIVKIHTMAPLETRGYPSVEPAQFALEVLAGTFADLGISEGDQVEIPDSVLKDAG